MAHENQWCWNALENLVDLERRRDEAKAEVERLNEQVGKEYDRIAHGSGRDVPDITATLAMIRAIGSPLDIENPREPEAPKVDPLTIPPHLDRRAEAAAE